MPEFAIFLTQRPDPPSPSRADVEEHCLRVNELAAQQRYIAAGPFDDERGGGMIVARFDSVEQARDFAESDPFVTCGFDTTDVRP